jgi:hypothetical protein
VRTAHPKITYNLQLTEREGEREIEREKATARNLDYLVRTKVEKEEEAPGSTTWVLLQAVNEEIQR